jgi:hypothetical protein
LVQPIRDFRKCFAVFEPCEPLVIDRLRFRNLADIGVTLGVFGLNVPERESLADAALLEPVP